MKIATYNVNGVNARLPVLLRWLADARPDIACLQELKAPQEKFPQDALREAGYHPIWHGQKSWNGVALLARGQDPVEAVRGLPGDPEDDRSTPRPRDGWSPAGWIGTFGGGRRRATTPPPGSSSVRARAGHPEFRSHPSTRDRTDPCRGV